MGFLLPAFAVLIIDQISKQLFWHLGRNFDLIDGVLRITLVKNRGAAFGMLQEGRTFLIVSSVIAALVIIFLSERMRDEHVARRACLGMIFGGALGNLIDRIYPGAVIDFIDMGVSTYRWPVYNLADAAVTIGGVLLVLHFSRRRVPSEG